MGHSFVMKSGFRGCRIYQVLSQYANRFFHQIDSTGIELFEKCRFRVTLPLKSAISFWQLAVSYENKIQLAHKYFKHLGDMKCHTLS